MPRRLQHFYQDPQLRTVEMRLVVRSVDIYLVIVRRALRAGARNDPRALAVRQSTHTHRRNADALLLYMGKRWNLET